MALKCASIDKLIFFADQNSNFLLMFIKLPSPYKLSLEFFVEIPARTMMQTEVWETIDPKNETVKCI